MAKKRRDSPGSLPPTGAGLIRYFDEDTKGIKFKPEHILIMALALVIIELFLRLYGPEILG